MKILLTGGAGYIGSHTAVELLSAGYDIVIIDNLSNSKASVVERIEAVSGKPVSFHNIDVLEEQAVSAICANESVEAVIHFAGLKAVKESVHDPLLYYSTNLKTTMSVCNAMRNNAIGKLVFSSSATVYGDPEHIPIRESDATNPANPYGRTKLVIEQMLTDLGRYYADFDVTNLRYFNPAGAHPSGQMGEDPSGPPDNLVPFITQVAIGQRPELTINGTDYETPDGTCIRDYLHVQDLARGHVAALGRLLASTGVFTYNLGTGRGSSVKEVVSAFEQSTGQVLKKNYGPRRAGDVPESWCDPSLAERELDWKAELTIEDICRDAWRWQQDNPKGYS